MTDDELVTEYLRTTSYDVPPDWRAHPELGLDDDEDDVTTLEEEGHAFHGNQWTGGLSGVWDSREIVKNQIALDERIDKIIGGSSLTHNVQISLTQPAVNAAGYVANTLQEMKDKGYVMPSSVSVLSENTSLRGVVQRGTHLEMSIPTELPPDAHLDLASATAFGGKMPDRPVGGGEGRWEPLGKREYINQDTGEVVDRDPNITSYDRFAGDAFKDLVVHEMAHVQMGAVGRLHQQFPSWIEDRTIPAILKVSGYASTSADEFVAEAFTRLYKGEKLGGMSQRIYDLLKGPTIK